jgi:hypothetical protein
VEDNLSAFEPEETGMHGAAQAPNAAADQAAQVTTTAWNEWNKPKQSG